LWRQLGQTDDMVAALGNWVRSITEPGAELDEACGALQQAAHTDSTPRNLVRANGALAVAARLRGDILEVLACSERQMRAARELGLEGTAQAADNNACTALFEVGRHAEAAERAQVLLARIDAGGQGDANGNLPWVLNVLIEALTALGRLAEARALVRRSLAASRRFDTTVAWQGILVLVAGEQRHEAAARLVGYVRRQWSLSGATPDRDEHARLERVEAIVGARLGMDAAAALAVHGCGLSDEAAAALAAEDSA
jgi:tetratricopeptide (TPR) repeat protein